LSIESWLWKRSGVPLVAQCVRQLWQLSWPAWQRSKCPGCVRLRPDALDLGARPLTWYPARRDSTAIPGARTSLALSISAKGVNDPWSIATRDVWSTRAKIRIFSWRIFATPSLGPG